MRTDRPGAKAHPQLSARLLSRTPHQDLSRAERRNTHQFAKRPPGRVEIIRYIANPGEIIAQRPGAIRNGGRVAHRPLPHFGCASLSIARHNGKLRAATAES